MGEAKRRSEALKEWRNGLTADEVTVAEVAQKVFERFVVPGQTTGMCYRLAFFLERLLIDKFDVMVEAVVGYVNDGSDDIYISHAWIELNGKRTDLSLAYLEHPEIALAGEVLIVDHILRAGHRYTYHRQRPIEGMIAARQLMADPRMGPLLMHKEEEHLSMEARAKSSDLRCAYLDSAPDGLTYEKMATIVLGEL